MKSHRSDGRGHWPAGRRRNAPSPSRQVLSRVRRVLVYRHSYGEISRRSLAVHIGVSDRTVRRWLDGTHIPSPEYLAALRRWAARYV